MDSINKQQPEDNTEHLNGAAAVKKIKELHSKSNTCFFCSGIKDGKPFQVRPMSVQKLDEEGIFYFLSGNDSHKNHEISLDPYVQLLFQGSPHSDFMSLYGRAEISTDKALIHELWEPMVKTWFTEGEDDPRITVLIVKPESGYYWDTKHGNAIAFLKVAIGAMTGKTLDDSIEGKLRV